MSLAACAKLKLCSCEPDFAIQNTLLFVEEAESGRIVVTDKVAEAMLEAADEMGAIRKRIDRVHAKLMAATFA